ncbi:MAG: LacI family transcriptional regulator [Treponema sp.]|jgi:LacI family transcriptional regulator|nr:LacI family transcriptional regulator [Treponema sp.]
MVASPATILDVAKLARVSPSTVTHALNGKRPVSRETRDRIVSAINTLGYIPSHSASHLRKGTSGIIGCYALDITEAFASKIVKGIEQGLVGSDLSMLFVSGVEFGNDFLKAFQFLLRHNIDGLLLCHHIPTMLQSVGTLKNAGLPVISINMELDGIKSIFPDNLNGGIIAADHLYASGMRCPAMICGPETRISSRLRFAGFKKRIDELGLNFPYSRFIYGDYSYEHGYNAAFQLVEGESNIDGICCANDYIAAGAINRLTAMGYKIPEDIRIIGYDNRDFSEFWPIPISTFEHPLEEMGFFGISALQCELRSGIIDMEPQILQPKLIPRTSTTGVRVPDTDLQ